MQAPVPRPVSAVSALTGWLGLAGFVVALTLVIALQPTPEAATMWVLAGASMPMLAAEIVSRRASMGGRASPFRIMRHFSGQRVLRKLAGYALVWGALWLWFALIPLYRRPEYFLVLLYLERVLPVLMLAGVLYILWCDRRMSPAHDGAWHLGAALWHPRAARWATDAGPQDAATGRHLQDSTPPAPDLSRASDFALGWFIKAFFMVFLLSILPGNLKLLSRFPQAPFDALGQLVFWSTQLLFTIDIVIATAGYALTFKWLDSHIRSVNPSLLGWMAALACYPPFGIIGAGNLIDYQSGGTYWDLWLAQAPALLKWSWGLALVACLCLYTWATLAFGIRFSNLTHRGILTHGPYRLLRHPAYVAKNLYWWLVHVPWINQLGPLAALKCCAMLLLVNALYALRAYTEERHLAEDPQYRQYRQWMRQTSLRDRIRAN